MLWQFKQEKRKPTSVTLHSAIECPIEIILGATPTTNAMFTNYLLLRRYHPKDGGDVQHHLHGSIAGTGVDNSATENTGMGTHGWEQIELEALSGILPPTSQSPPAIL